MDLQIKPRIIKVHCDETFRLDPVAADDRIRVVYATPQEVTAFKLKVSLDMKSFGLSLKTLIELGSIRVEIWSKK